MNFKKLLLCAAIVPMLASCGNAPKDEGLTFNVGDTFTFLDSGENIKEGTPSVFSFLQDEGIEDVGFLAVRNKKQAFNLVISNCQSIIINKEDKENNRYEFTYGTTESKETEGCIRKDASFGNEEGEKDYCNRGLGSCTYHKGESDFNYTAYAVFKKFDKDAMKIYFDFKITKQPVGGDKVSYADAMTINIAKAQ